MNFKEILSSIKSYLFTGTSLVGIVMFLAGMGYRGRFRPTGDSNIYLSLTGIILLIPCLVCIIRFTFKKKAAKKREEEQIKKLKSTGFQIEIDLQKVKIRSNSHRQKIITDNSRYAGLNELTGRSDRNFKYVTKTTNRIYIDQSINGKRYKYSELIEMDTDTLKIHFVIQKKRYFLLTLWTKKICI